MPKSEIPLRAKFAAALLDHSPDWSAMAASQMVGSMARVSLPSPITKTAISIYARYFDVDLTELDAGQLQSGYPTFDQFFTRSLKEGARPLAQAADTLISPCDGSLRESVPVTRNSTVVAKGHEYTIGELLADDELAESFVGGRQTTIYLHPRDYHRVHAPCDCQARALTLVPGRLLPVTTASLRREPRLFALNERLVHVLDSPFGSIAVVMVAAFGVGHMSASYLDIQSHPKQIRSEFLNPAVPLVKGDELGIFHLGSTVIMLTQEGLELCPDVEPGKIRLGEALLKARKGV